MKKLRTSFVGHRVLATRNSNPEQQYMSLPRRLSAQSKSSSKVDRRQSFQDFKTFRDKFTGPLDFKNTLRSSSSAGAGARGRDDRGRKSRQLSEPRDRDLSQEIKNNEMLQQECDWSEFLWGDLNDWKGDFF